MSDALLGLDPADFGTTGLTLGLLVGVALNEPERVLDRGRVYGRGGGAETMQSWRHRAVTELLRRHGVDLDTLLPAARPEPVPAPTTEHLVSAVPETSPLWHGTVLAVRPHPGTDMWVIEHRSCRLFWTRFHDWMPDLHNAAQFPEEKALRIADGLALHLVASGIEVADTLRAARSADDDPR